MKPPEPHDFAAESTRSPPVRREPSPSSGAADVAEALDAEPGATHAPTCDVLECDREGHPVRVRDGEGVRRAGVRCEDHEPEFFEVNL